MACVVERSLATQKIGPLPGNSLGQAAHMHVPLSPSSIIWYRPLSWKVTASITESNGSLPPSGWLKVNCGLTACTLGSAPVPTLGNEYGKTLPLPFLSGTTRLSRYQKSTTNLDLPKQETASGKIISWTMQDCTSLQTDNYASNHQF